MKKPLKYSWKFKVDYDIEKKSSDFEFLNPDPKLDQNLKRIFKMYIEA